MNYHETKEGRAPAARLAAVLFAAVFTTVGAAAQQPAAANQFGADRELLDLAYGPRDSNKLDLWLAPSKTPTPLIVQIHGGGFREGDKAGFRRWGRDAIRRSAEKGVSCAALNYPFIDVASLQDIERDAALAIQFLRYHAKEWNLDKTRIVSFGDSAGAGTSLWLAFHDDLADPENSDPVRRESTRLFAAGAQAPQATYDFAAWPEIVGIPVFTWWISLWYVSPTYYHLPALQVNSPEGRRIRADLDIRALIDDKDPPIFIEANRPRAWFNPDILHDSAHARVLEKACKSHNVPCTVVVDRVRGKDQEKKDVFDFFFDCFFTASALARM